MSDFSNVPGATYHQPSVEDFKNAVNGATDANTKIKVNDKGVVALGGRTWILSNKFDPERQAEARRAIEELKRTILQVGDNDTARKLLDDLIGDQSRMLAVGKATQVLVLQNRVQDLLNAIQNAHDDDHIQFSRAGDIEVVSPQREAPTNQPLAPNDREIRADRRAIAGFMLILSREHGKERADYAFGKSGVAANGPLRVEGLRRILDELRPVGDIRYAISKAESGWDVLRFKEGQFEIVPYDNGRGAFKVRGAEKRDTLENFRRALAQEYGEEAVGSAFKKKRINLKFPIHLNVSIAQSLLNLAKVENANSHWNSFPDREVEGSGAHGDSLDRGEGTRKKGPVTFGERVDVVPPRAETEQG